MGLRNNPKNSSPSVVKERRLKGSEVTKSLTLVGKLVLPELPDDVIASGEGITYAVFLAEP